MQIRLRRFNLPKAIYSAGIDDPEFRRRGRSFLEELKRLVIKP